MIELTPAAIKEIKRIQTSRQQPDSYFRLGVTEGGCSGLYYTFQLSETPEESDRLYPFCDLTLIIDSASLPYVEDLRLDYAEDLMGGGFRFTNFQAKSSCSCGLSFAYQS
jgi:iron-sulfur cluster assembly protein